MYMPAAFAGDDADAVELIGSHPLAQVVVIDGGTLHASPLPMIVRKSDAERFGLRNISDLTRVAKTIRPGFGYEFTERADNDLIATAADRIGANEDESQG